MKPKPNSKKKRRSMRFGLKLLLLLIVVASLGLAWFGRALQQARFEENFVKKIELLNDGEPFCEYWYDYESGSRGTAKKVTGKPRGYAWIRSVFGKNVFSRIDRMAFTGLTYGDELLTFSTACRLKVSKVCKSSKV